MEAGHTKHEDLIAKEHWHAFGKQEVYRELRTSEE